MSSVLSKSRRPWTILSAACVVLLIGCNQSPRETISWATISAPSRIPATPGASPSVDWATPHDQAVPHVAPVFTLPDTPEQLLASDLLAGEAGVYGFVVLEHDGTVVASINGTTPFITASLYKLVLMADIYQRIESGVLRVDEWFPLEAVAFDIAGDMYFAFDDIGTWYTLEEYLFAVGAYSSNAAARTLLDLTSTESLRNTALAIGMDRTYLFADLADLPYWPPIPGHDASVDDVDLAQRYLEGSAAYGTVNVTTPLDMARYQLALMNGTLLSPWVSEQIMAVLEQQLIRDRIPFYFGEEVRVLNKPGNLEDAVNDVGVMYLPDGPRAIVMLAQAVPDTDRATLVQQRLALIASGAEDIPPMPIDDGDGESQDGVGRVTGTADTLAVPVVCSANDGTGEGF